MLSSENTVLHYVVHCASVCFLILCQHLIGATVGISNQIDFSVFLYGHFDNFVCTKAIRDSSPHNQLNVVNVTANAFICEIPEVIYKIIVSNATHTVSTGMVNFSAL